MFKPYQAVRVEGGPPYFVNFVGHRVWQSTGIEQETRRQPGEREWLVATETTTWLINVYIDCGDEGRIQVREREREREINRERRRKKMNRVRNIANKRRNMNRSLLHVINTRKHRQRNTSKPTPSLFSFCAAYLVFLLSLRPSLDCVRASSVGEEGEMQGSIGDLLWRVKERLAGKTGV